jgi:sulfur-oxidizing protein SoxA
MRGVAARYPSFEVESKRPIDLQERINICRSRHQNATPFGFESRELLALSAFVAYQSRGVPIQITIDERLNPFFDAGRVLFEARQGQLNISCAQCHDDNWGSAWLETLFRKHNRPDTQCIGWSGRSLGPCNGACVIA